MSFWRNSTVKTRKPHMCEFCGRTIPAGETAIYCAGKWEGEFQSYYFCERCSSFVDKYDIDLTEGFSCGDFMEHLYGYLDCPACKRGGRLRDYEWDADMMVLSLECDECDHKWQEDWSMKQEARA